MARKKIHTEIETKILVESRRICCICFSLDSDINVKRGQIAHLDKDNTNGKEDNLAFLCLPHHDQYDSRTSQSKNFTLNEVKRYKAELLQYTNELTKARRTIPENNQFEKQKPATEDAIEKMDVMNIAVYGCFTVDEENVSIDLDCEEINLAIQNSINATKSRIYSFSNSILLHFVHIPNTLSEKWGYRTLNEAITQNIYNVPHVATIHFVNNKKNHRLHAIVNYHKELLSYSTPSETAQRLINQILDNEEFAKNEAINISLNIFYLVYSQVHLDMLIEEKKYKDLHYTIDGCEKLALEIRSSCENIPANQIPEFSNFLNFWFSHCKRYRSICFFHEKEYHGAVSNIFKAISLNPFYPYSNYDALKSDYTKRYAVELVHTLNEHQQGLKLDITPEENLAVAEELYKQIEYKEVSYHYEILLQIMYENEDDPYLIKQIEEELNKFSENSPFLLITKSEVVRYLKKGRKRYNKIYAARFEAAAECLRKAAKLDPDFPILKPKLAGLLLAKAMHSLSPKAMYEAIEIYRNELYFLAQLGFRMRAKS